MDITKVAETLRYLKGLDLYLEFLGMSDKAELERTYTLKMYPDKKESINLDLSDVQILAFYAWLREEKARLDQQINSLDPEIREAAYEVFKGKSA